MVDICNIVSIACDKMCNALQMIHLCLPERTLELLEMGRLSCVAIMINSWNGYMHQRDMLAIKH